MNPPTLARDPIMLFHCPRCGTDYDAEEFRGDEVPRCTEGEGCEPNADGLQPTLDAVFRSDLLAGPMGVLFW